MWGAELNSAAAFAGFKLPKEFNKNFIIKQFKSYSESLPGV